MEIFKIWSHYVRRLRLPAEYWMSRLPKSVKKREFTLDIQKPIHRPSFISYSIWFFLCFQILRKFDKTPGQQSLSSSLMEDHKADGILNRFLRLLIFGHHSAWRLSTSVIQVMTFRLIHSFLWCDMFDVQNWTKLDLVILWQPLTSLPRGTLSSCKSMQCLRYVAEMGDKRSRVCDFKCHLPRRSMADRPGGNVTRRKLEDY